MGGEDVAEGVVSSVGLFVITVADADCSMFNSSLHASRVGWRPGRPRNECSQARDRRPAMTTAADCACRGLSANEEDEDDEEEEGDDDDDDGVDAAALLVCQAGGILLRLALTRAERSRCAVLACVVAACSRDLAETSGKVEEEVDEEVVLD